MGVTLSACTAGMPPPAPSTPWTPVPWRPAAAEDPRSLVTECSGESFVRSDADEALAPEEREAAARAAYDSTRDAFVNGDYEGALVHARRACAMSPERPALLFNLATILERLGRRREATWCLERYVETANLDGQARDEILRRARALRGR